MLFSALEFFFAFHYSSRAILTDAVFDFVIFVFAVCSTVFSYRVGRRRKKRFFLNRMLSELLALFRSLILTAFLAVMLGLAVVSLFQGRGDGLDANAFVGEAVLFSLSLGVYLLLTLSGRGLESPLLEVEKVGWKSNLIGTLGMGCAFLALTLLSSHLPPIVSEYADLGASVLVSAVLLIEPLRLLFRSLRSLLLIPKRGRGQSILQNLPENFCREHPDLEVFAVGNDLYLLVPLEEGGFVALPLDAGHP